MPIKIPKEAISRACELIRSAPFTEFLKPQTDRCAFICAWLKKYGIPHTAVELAGKRHIIVRYGAEFYDPAFTGKTLAVHYDREKNTQGANDNSAACFQMMLFAKYLLKEKTAHNITIIFTDGEEAGSRGIAEQGAYSLGFGLKKLKKDTDDIFVFDMCGAGDTLILSRSGIAGREKGRIGELDALHKRAAAYADKSCPGRWLSMLTPYSDNAGFIAAGLYAQVITVLPRAEAEVLLHNLPKSEINMLQLCSPHQAKPVTAVQDLIDHIIKNKKCAPHSPLKKIIPRTWQYMHTACDTVETLTPEAFIITGTYLRGLIRAEIPACRNGKGG